MLLFAVLLGLAVAGPVSAQAPAPAPAPDKLHTLAELLQDPEIRGWLQSQVAAGPAAQATAAAAPAPADAGSMKQSMSIGIDTTRAFLRSLVAAAPTLPAELGQAWHVLVLDLEGQGLIWTAVSLLLFVGLGFGAEKLYWRLSARFRRRLIDTHLETLHGRLQAVWLRSLYGLGLVFVFGVGSIGAFLLFEWPPLLQQIVLSYLLLVLIVRVTLVLGRIILAPGAERFRLVPMATPTAHYWFVWAAVLVGWFFFIQATLDNLETLGLRREAWYLVGLASSVVMLGLTLAAVWRAPTFDGSDRVGHGHRVGTWLLTLYLVVVWLLLFSGSVAPFYVGVILLLLPIALRGVHLAVSHVLRPAGAEAAEPVPSLLAVTLERGFRALLVIGAALLIASVSGVDLSSLTMRDTLSTRLLRGAINAAIVFLVANFAWHLLRAWIDQRIATANVEGHGGTDATSSDQIRRHARLRTLLPILKNVLFVVLAVMAGLIALAALGVEIGPLIAGAGVVGLAVGFGAQTLVKDIISGMFFLFDDAFRIGEYIESGSIRGTVEGFSLRSLKLRHQRGALHTIPFGALDKITNYSRDWVIDKMTISVTYDTDLDKIKPIVKEIGQALQADPLFAPHILETLKMQGVDQLGDFAIQIRLKMMTKPGEQFVIRRKALAMIKKAFDANGIAFAFPTVTVAGGGAATGAVAQHALDLAKPPAPAG
ncbi:small-conductance mechanosensitive channel [Inquilinus ginsengisoli]|uniref:Small-conductance mechanosensitive channel n=1 Tax=Inquilinus ginsengisoli TaxID=363840 RepID=A0ABU1JMD8_9PROT|nr:mechanosensitive ion channel family protein [Inquilinus ginsengisoli]MDR6289508.1 small-conductance mechanosensitive channel [Inquilinus ginsengisoli]